MRPADGDVHYSEALQMFHEAAAPKSWPAGEAIFPKMLRLTGMRSQAPG